ncbi:MAG: OmpA family protein [Spirochaetales bacterium]|nr:OmpA family protein [Spirochaetales bacterium]
MASLFTVNVSAQSTSIQLVFGSSNKLKITERSNIRVTENGVYRGLTYNESRGVLSYMWHEDGFSQYAGNYYVYEASVNDTRLIANPINLSEYCEIGISDQGRYNIPEDQLLPVLRDFPVFPDKEIEPGDSWRDFGVRIVDPENSGRYTRVKFYCEYKYQGLKEVSTGLKHIISAQYALRYKPGDSSVNDPDLKQISGRHLVTIMIDDADRSSIFIRDTIDEQYIYFSGKMLEHKGFILTWYNDIIGMNRGSVADVSRKELEKDAVKDVDIIEKAEGLSLSIRNLHFVPDSADLLSEDDGRIASIYKLLNEIGVKKILAVGHTADIGTKESQYILSEQRAKTVIDKLVSLGMNPAMFLYEGRGGDEPAAGNDTPEGRASNRRVELILLDD